MEMRGNGIEVRCQVLPGVDLCVGPWMLSVPEDALQILLEHVLHLRRPSDHRESGRR